MSTPDPHWFKSSYSGGGGDSCVEVAHAPGAVHVRDSKDTRITPLTLSPTAWTAFLTHAVGPRTR
ncbi:DUF397 domain-containing protein [Streptomyces roseolilacinus]|uniref:DUF397 domain-containing protein n=1 Tax=Streptomyces roseolilacinus TaxID=66904 RepID=A0A918EM78_9ACTN|nr:DUF397 domain-containing protein [Streptomyces roseolilacinus]GGQ21181.1 hypothetical protein GCM10010249_44800 [Streptomyces roseolilacinus]